MIKPKSTNTDAFNALCTPDTNSSTLGMNLKNRKALNTLNILNTRRKLTSNISIRNRNAAKAGMDNKTNIKSSLFQLELKYFLNPYSLIFIANSKMKSNVMKWSIADKNNSMSYEVVYPPTKRTAAFNRISSRMNRSFRNKLLFTILEVL